MRVNSWASSQHNMNLTYNVGRSLLLPSAAYSNDKQFVRTEGGWGPTAREELKRSSELCYRICLFICFNKYVSAVLCAGHCSKHLTLTPSIIFTVELIQCIDHLLVPRVRHTPQTINMQALSVMLENILPYQAFVKVTNCAGAGGDVGEMLRWLVLYDSDEMT